MLGPGALSKGVEKSTGLSSHPLSDCFLPVAQPSSLLQQLQHLLRQLVGLGDHGGARLLQDLGAAQVGRFLGKVRIGDATACSRDVLLLDVDVLNRLFKSGLDSAQLGTGRADFVQGAVNALQRLPRRRLGF